MYSESTPNPNGADEEREHAEKLQKYLNLRGGRLILSDIKAPPTEYESGLSAMEAALQLERDVNESLLNMHKVSCALMLKPLSLVR